MGASGAASTAVRSARMTWPRSSAASSRALSDPRSRSASVASRSSVPTVRGWRMGDPPSESDDDVQVTGAAKDLDRYGAVRARETEIDQRVAHAQVAQVEPRQ